MAKTKQLSKPCEDCAFRLDCEPGNLGGSTPETYIGQIMGPFWIPCHESREYRGKDSEHGEERECRGAATLRANMGLTSIMPEGLEKPEPDHCTVFSGLVQFLAHHTGLTFADALRRLLEPGNRPLELMQKEMEDADVRALDKS